MRPLPVSRTMAIISHPCLYTVLVGLLNHAYGNVVFQPSFILTSGPKVTAYLLGNNSGISLILTAVQPSNTTGALPLPVCAEGDPGQWFLLAETVEKNTLKVELSLNHSLQLCGNTTDCCLQPLCVLETLQVLACQDALPRARLLVQAQIYAVVLPTRPVSENKTVIPNQAFEPLGPCPCDLTHGTCDVLCCCDQDCSPGALQLFKSKCFPGVFGGNVTPAPDYQCSVQSSRNDPDWFPFLCVTSPADNSPYLGLFFQGKTITPRRGPSFQSPTLTAPLPESTYRQGDPIFTEVGQYFTIPQRSMVGQCLDNAPVAFLQNFQFWCPRLLASCPTGPPLRTTPSDLKIRVRDGFGGFITVSVVEEVAGDLSPFVSSPGQTGKPNITESSLFPGRTQASTSATIRNQSQIELCHNVTLAMDYTAFWRGNGLTDIVLVRVIGNVPLDPGVFVTTRYSAVFVNGDASAQPNSGNPGYINGKPVIAGTLDKGTGTVQRSPISLWQPVGDGLCASAGRKPVVFGENVTAGCLLRLAVQDLEQCGQLRETVRTGLAALVMVTFVARSGNPDAANLTDWVNITFVPLNVSTASASPPGVCEDIPSHLNIHIYSTEVQLRGRLQKLILAMEVSYTLSTWRVECGGGDSLPCTQTTVTQSFPVSSAVTFISIPAQTPPPKTRFQINFTEFDCDRNDVCWPQLAYPLTRYYTGEPYSLSLAKGLILVFLFIAASLLGNLWRQICQVWRSFWV
ncbi:tectonic-2 [Arapaima gigas]